MANKSKIYQVSAKVTVTTTTNVLAENLEEAVVKSKTLEVDDFVDVLGELFDSSFNITGLFEV